MFQDGNSCAHIAAMQGSIRVIEELMKFDRQGVISARNRITEATPLQLAAEGGHAEVVKALVRAGASCTDENKVRTSLSRLLRSTVGWQGVHLLCRLWAACALCADESKICGGCVIVWG